MEKGSAGSQPCFETKWRSVCGMPGGDRGFPCRELNPKFLQPVVRSWRGLYTSNVTRAESAACK